MAYTIQVTENIEGICISSSTSSKNTPQFTVSEIFSESVAASLGISIGDTIQSVNGKCFTGIVSRYSLKDPSCTLWDIPLPFTLTLIKGDDVDDCKTMDKIDVMDGISYSSDDDAEESKREITFHEPALEWGSPTTPTSAINNGVGYSDGIDWSAMTTETVTETVFENQEMSVYRYPFGSRSLPPSKPIPELILPPQFDDYQDLNTRHGHSRSISISYSHSECSSQSSFPGFGAMEKSPKFGAISPKSYESATNSTAPSTPSTLSDRLLRRHFHQKYSLNPFVHFDMASITKSNGKIIAVSSKPLKYGVHEWTLEIMKCDIEIQEVGVCTVCDIEGIEIDDRGVTETKALGARGVYGSELATDSVWYSSMNDCGGRRCYKDLTQSHCIGWTAKVILKVVLNLEKMRIRFFLNGQKVCICLLCTCGVYMK